jgi:hypothetical protein
MAKNVFLNIDSRSTSSSGRTTRTRSESSTAGKHKNSSRLTSGFFIFLPTLSIPGNGIAQSRHYRFHIFNRSLVQGGNSPVRGQHKKRRNRDDGNRRIGVAEFSSTAKHFDSPLGSPAGNVIAL